MKDLLIFECKMNIDEYNKALTGDYCYNTEYGDFIHKNTGIILDRENEEIINYINGIKEELKGDRF